MRRTSDCSSRNVFSRSLARRSRLLHHQSASHRERRRCAARRHYPGRGRFVTTRRQPPAADDYEVDRLLADGSALDASFGTGGRALAMFAVASSATPRDAVLGPDGKLTVTCLLISSSLGTSLMGTARFLDLDATTTALASSAGSPTER